MDDKNLAGEEELTKTPVAHVDIQQIAGFQSDIKNALKTDWLDAPGYIVSSIDAKTTHVCGQLRAAVQVGDRELMQDAHMLYKQLGKVRGGDAYRARLKQLIPTVDVLEKNEGDK